VTPHTRGVISSCLAQRPQPRYAGSGAQTGHSGALAVRLGSRSPVGASMGCKAFVADGNILSC
jgi:hypothetical protein